MGRADLRAIDALGLLTIAAYGSWFYGFGVLVGDISADVGVGVGTLGVLYGVTTLVGGAMAIGVGRLLDRRGPRVVLAVAGPVASVLYALSSVPSGAVPFCVLFAVSGGMIGACGFYSFTQPVSMRARPDDTVRAVTRLTIWGAFASPVMIPLTELARNEWGWRGAVRSSAVVLLVFFAVSAAVVRVSPRTNASAGARLTEVMRRAWSSTFLRLYAASAFLSAVSISSLLVYQVPVMKWAGVSAAAAASFAGARGLFQLFGRLPLVALVSKWGPWRLQFACRVGVVAGAVALGFSGARGSALVYVVVIGACTGALAAVDGMVAREILDEENFATMMSILGFVGTLGGASGPVVVGLIVEGAGSLGVVPAVVAVGAGTSAVIQRVSMRHRTA